MLKQKLVFFLLVCAFFAPLSAQESDEDVLDVIGDQVEHVDDDVVIGHAFSDTLEELNRALQSAQYAQALYHLDTLSSKVREQHAKGIRQFFPKKVGRLQSSSWKSSSGDVGFDSAQYVVFSSQLADEEDNTIEFHVISEDPSILEYATLVKKPRLVKALQDTTIVSIKSYKALQKANEENNLLEHNIVISETLMLNVFISGHIEPETVSRFYDAVDFQGLLNYINK